MPRLGLVSSLSGGSVASGPNLSFRTQWGTAGASEANRTVTLPLVNDGNSINFTVDWGDGSVNDTITAWDDTGAGTSKVHIYDDHGTYVIVMRGTISGFKFDNGGDKLKLKKILNWGNFIISMDDAFYGCTHLAITATDAPDLSDITTASDGLQRCFQGCAALTSIGSVADWNMSPVQNISHMFEGCTLFNQDISSWDVGAVTAMASTFKDCEAFNQDIGFQQD